MSTQGLAFKVALLGWLAFAGMGCSGTTGSEGSDTGGTADSWSTADLTQDLLPDESPGDWSLLDGPVDDAAVDQDSDVASLEELLDQQETHEGFCGDGDCLEPEDCQSCPQDCSACPAECGDGICTDATGEDCETCPEDCSQCAPTCGDDSCNGQEDCTSCPGDCGQCPPDCGDGTCDPGIGEDCETCSADCGQCPPKCGDGTCDSIEDCGNCPSDCGLCPLFCGDGSCDASTGETCATCPDDCGGCPVVCGNGICHVSETCVSCPEDCGDCPDPCGDGVCSTNQGETCTTCPDDCGSCVTCGDSICQSFESCLTCPLDCGACPPQCGDQACNGDETCVTCPADCGDCTPECGDELCNGSETCADCPVDCGTCPPQCGDQACNGAETCLDCPEDCGECPVECGDGTCDGSTEDCDSCPQDCGACPPTVEFTQWWEERLSAPFVQGGKIRIRYDWTRLPDCRSTHNGYPGWDIVVYYTFDLNQEAQQVSVKGYNSNTNTTYPVSPEIEVPSDATQVFLWVQNFDYTGCSTWDSDFGENYVLPVFSASTLSQDIGWAGNFHFIRYTEAGPQFLGDIDPAYYFAQFGGSEIATWVQAEVYVPGITDRTYQNDDVQQQVAAVALNATRFTDAYEGSTPGADMKRFPLEFIGKPGNNFAYRWFPGPLTWNYGSAIPEGAYLYLLQFKTPSSQNTHSIYKTGTSGYRTMVLGQGINCALFPSNPPTDYCP